MRYLKPHYYDKFTCIADKCPDTCCAGWQIMIDEESLDYYQRVKGNFGNRLRNSVDWEEGAFYQYDRRCSFLNERNLCDIYGELGPDALCDTCRMYPRHTEEYEGLRELSLSLSCPAAAEMILGCMDKVKFLESFTEEEEEFEDFDFLMFTQLEDARDVIFHILQNRSLDMSLRMKEAEMLALDFQRCIDEERAFEIDELLERYDERYGKEKKELFSEASEEDISYADLYRRRLEEFQLLESLERLRPEWTKLLRQANRLLYSQGQDRYEEICRTFQETYGSRSPHRAQWDNIGEQLMMFFTYTYFCGSVYDDMVYSKMALAIFSTTWIQELLMARWLENSQTLTFHDIVEISYRLAREIEHSDNNLNGLEDAFQNKINEK